MMKGNPPADQDKNIQGVDTGISSSSMSPSSVQRIKDSNDNNNVILI